MGKKKMREKDGHKRENKQVEEGKSTEERSDVLDVSTGNMNDVPKSSSGDGDKNEKGDRIKKRKSDFDADQKEYRKSHKKHKKSEDLVEGEKEYRKSHKKHKKSEDLVDGEEISKKITDQESNEAINSENNGEAKRSRKDKHKKKNKDGLEHSKRTCSPEDTNKINVADENGTGKEISKKITDQESSEANNLENNGEAKRPRKDKHKKKNKDGLEHSKMQEPVEEQRTCSPEDTNKINVADESGTGKEISKKITDQESSEANNLENNGEAKRPRKDKHKKKNKDGLEHSKMQDPVEEQRISSPEDINKINVADENGTGKENAAGSEIECRKSFGHTEDGNGCKKKKLKLKSVMNDSEGGHHEGDQVENATSKVKSKKVSFRDQVEVFPSDNVTDNANKKNKEGLVQGKRFSKEEDELLMNAVAEYIESHDLGADGLNMVMNCRGHSQVRNCWKEIQAAIPWRPVYSVYHRAHVIFERDEKHPWTPEELETIQKFVEKHGHNWRLLADSLGKYRHHVKDTWRRIKLTNTNKGRWSQSEYQSLFDLVNLDLSMKANQERISKHGMLRDNICWTAISDKMETRPFASCCDQWYRKLTSPMVAEGLWADVDDYRMVDAISSLDACCMEDVDWDNLLEHRSGDLCRKRWDQMVKHLGTDKHMTFAEQVDVLAERYRPDMVEARETYDSKRPIDLP